MCHYVAGLLDEIGVGVTLHESEPGRVTLVAEWAPEGTDTSRPALLLHGHSDTVPFEAADWTHHPLSGEIHDNCVCVGEGRHRHEGVSGDGPLGYPGSSASR